jgi:hypothetical protein
MAEPIDVLLSAPHIAPPTANAMAATYRGVGRTGPCFGEEGAPDRSSQTRPTMKPATTRTIACRPPSHGTRRKAAIASAVAQISAMVTRQRSAATIPRSKSSIQGLSGQRYLGYPRSTRPGFIRFSGSSACLMARIMPSATGDLCFSSLPTFRLPTPCSAEIEPPNFWTES